MLRTLPVVVLCVIATPAAAATPDDASQACEALNHAQAIFVGRPQPPTTVNVSFEHKIEPARQKWLKAKEEADGSKDFDVHVRALKARDEYEALRIQFPPPTIMVLAPIHVETRFKS